MIYLAMITYGHYDERLERSLAPGLPLPSFAILNAETER